MSLRELEEEGYVFIHKAFDFNELLHGVRVYDRNGKEIAIASFLFNPDTNEIHPHPEFRTEVDLGHRKKGIASEMYCFIEKKLNGVMVPGKDQTLGAKRLWKSRSRKFGAV